MGPRRDQADGQRSLGHPDRAREERDTGGHLTEGVGEQQAGPRHALADGGEGEGQDGHVGQPVHFGEDDELGPSAETERDTVGPVEHGPPHLAVVAFVAAAPQGAGDRRLEAADQTGDAFQASPAAADPHEPGEENGGDGGKAGADEDAERHRQESQPPDLGADRAEHDETGDAQHAGGGQDPDGDGRAGAPARELAVGVDGREGKTGREGVGHGATRQVDGRERAPVDVCVARLEQATLELGQGGEGHDLGDHRCTHQARRECTQPACTGEQRRVLREGGDDHRHHGQTLGHRPPDGSGRGPGRGYGDAHAPPP